jgi:SAM-dependent methyltransferase
MMSTNYLSTPQAQTFYDGFGAKQDAQGVYEDAALDVLVAEGAFDRADSVLEFGCGTGRLAERLLEYQLPATARYAGTDLSAAMVGLARQRLARFGKRVTLWQGDGPADFAPARPPVARLVTSYVLDLLPPDQIDAFLGAAHAALLPGGLLCTVCLGTGTTPLSRLTARVWGGIARLRPQLVGGCRPISLVPRLNAAAWRVRHHSGVAPWTVPSEIVIAQAI